MSAFTKKNSFMAFGFHHGLQLKISEESPVFLNSKMTARISPEY